MGKNIGVSFSPVGTVNSTIVSLESLIRQVPKFDGKVARVSLEDRWLRIELQEEEGNSDYELLQDGSRLSLPLRNLSLDVLKRALTEYMNRLFSLQVKYGGIYDVQNLELHDGVFSLELKESSFRSKEVQLNKFDEAREQNRRETNDPQALMAASNRLLLIDASNLVHACYYATAAGKDEKDLMKSSAGVYTNAIKALIDRFISVVRIYAPTHCAVAIDSKRSELYRRDIYSEYKANRDGKEKPASLEQQIPVAYELFEAMNIPQLKVERMEADDTIAALTNRWISENRGDVIVLSNDKDLHQLLDGKVTQVLSGNVEVTRDPFIAKFGINPEQFADYKALCGETGDNIPGVPGVGDKSAVKLLNEYQSLEGIIANISQLKGKLKEKIEQHVSIAEMSKRLAILYTDLPQLASLNMDDLAMKVNKEGMRSVLERLEINFSRSAA